MSRKIKEYSARITLDWFGKNKGTSEKKVKENIKINFKERYGIELRNKDIILFLIN